jgi:hypothetical protein
MGSTSPKTRTGIAGHFTPARFQRLAAGVPARRLAAVSQIDPSRLSRAERGLLQLRPEEEEARKRALEFCAAEAATS